MEGIPCYNVISKLIQTLPHSRTPISTILPGYKKVLQECEEVVASIEQVMQEDSILQEHLGIVKWKLDWLAQEWTKKYVNNPQHALKEILLDFKESDFRFRWFAWYHDNDILAAQPWWCISGFSRGVLGQIRRAEAGAVLPAAGRERSVSWSALDSSGVLSSWHCQDGTVPERDEQVKSESWSPDLSLGFYYASSFRSLIYLSTRL